MNEPIQSAPPTTSQESLINCPYCVSQISSHAKKCRYCGETLDHILRAVEDLKKQQQSRQSMVFMNAGGGSSATDIPQQFPSPVIASGPQSAQSDGNLHWTSIVSLISGIFAFVGACTEPDGKWDADSVTGVAMISLVPIIFGIISLVSNKKKRWMAVTGLILGILVFIMALASK